MEDHQDEQFLWWTFEEAGNFESAREMIIESDEKTSYFDYENVQY